MHGISCVKEHLLLCGKRRGVTALIILVTLENRPISSILEGVTHRTECKKDDRNDCINYIVIKFYQLQTQLHPLLF